MAEQIRVLLVDDHAIVRNGLTNILAEDPSITVVGEACDGLEAIKKAVELKPDVVIMDIYMPRCTGLDAMMAIREKCPETKVLMLTVSEREEDVFRALRFGAQGYLLKNAAINEVIDAVKMTASGESMLSPQIAARLVAEFRERGNEPDLSSREKEVLQFLGNGLTNTEIAKRLYIGESTVRTYVRRLLDKLQLRNRAEAVAYINRNSATKRPASRV